MSVFKMLKLPLFQLKNSNLVHCSNNSICYHLNYVIFIKLQHHNYYRNHNYCKIHFFIMQKNIVQQLRKELIPIQPRQDKLGKMQAILPRPVTGNVTQAAVCKIKFFICKIEL